MRSSKSFCPTSTPAKHLEIAYGPVLADLSLIEAICIKHTRKVARGNTVKYHWRVLQLLPEMDHPGCAGLQVEVLGEPPFSRGQALPGYSSDFNADEAIWGWVRAEATGNLCLGTKAAVQQRVGNFFSCSTKWSRRKYP